MLTRQKGFAENTQLLYTLFTYKQFIIFLFCCIYLYLFENLTFFFIKYGSCYENKKGIIVLKCYERMITENILFCYKL